jgi:hypothetical protein
VVLHRIRTIFALVAYHAARLGNRLVEEEARDFVLSHQTTGETGGRLFGRLAFALHERGDEIGAAAGFSRAIHEARRVHRRTGAEDDPHGIASALFSVALDEYRAGLRVEARAHILEAWDRAQNADPGDYVLVEIIRTMGQLGMEQEAVRLADTFSSLRRREQALGSIARGLAVRVAEFDFLTADEREACLALASSLIDSIGSAEGRQESTHDVLVALMPRTTSYIDRDPIPAARQPFLKFLFGRSANEAGEGHHGLLPASLLSVRNTQLAVRICIRQLKSREHSDLLEEIFRTAARA